MSLLFSRNGKWYFPASISLRSMRVWDDDYVIDGNVSRHKISDARPMQSRDTNEMHFPEDRQKFIRNLVHRRETWRGNKADSNVYITSAMLSTDFWDLFLPLVDGVDKLIRQARALRNLKWVVWVSRMNFYSTIRRNDFDMTLAEYTRISIPVLSAGPLT